MKNSQFARLAADGYNRVAVTGTALADLDTPLSAYLKLASGPYSYLLESVEGGEKWGRYSIIGLPARRIVRASGDVFSVTEDGHEAERTRTEDPLGAVRDYMARFRVAPDPAIGRFTGGLVGYFGYDTVRSVEPRLALTAPPDELATPDILLMVSDEFVVFDSLRGEMQFVVFADPGAAETIEAARARIESLVQRLREPLGPDEPARLGTVTPESGFKSGFAADDFKAAVARIKRYIHDGDAMQVVLSQRMATPLRARPVDCYRALRHLNPSPYLYFMDLDDFHIVGSSPEILVRVEDEVVTTRPLAGTRRRGQTPEEDQALERELLADPKELAEHLMLIDLGRNDVGRVAEIGSVRVTEQMVIERYSHVMHISSNVEGRLRPGLDALDVLKATLPVGTLSGAPKVRAMQIIDELEPVKRGVYGGAVGYLSWNGNMDTAIAIRTALIKDGTLYIQAGCGVVADSEPQAEWEETLNKGRAIFKAVAMAERGLVRED